MNNTFINEDYTVKMGGLKAPSISKDDFIAYLKVEYEGIYQWGQQNNVQMDDPVSLSDNNMIESLVMNILNEVGLSGCTQLVKVYQDLTSRLDISSGFENVSDIDVKSINDKIPYVSALIGQDYTSPAVIYFYWDGDGVRAFVPIKGNWINVKTKTLYGEDEDEDADEFVRQGLNPDLLDEEPLYEKCLEEFAAKFGISLAQSQPQQTTSGNNQQGQVINSDIPYGRIRFTVPPVITQDQFYKMIRQKLNKYAGIAKDDIRDQFPGLNNVLGLGNQELVELLGELLYWSYITRWTCPLGTECKDDLGNGGYSNDTSDPDTEVIEDGITKGTGIPYIRHRIYNAYGLEHVIYFFYDGTNFRGYIPLVGNWIYPRLMQTYEGVPDWAPNGGAAWLDECQTDFETCFGATSTQGKGAVDPNSLEGQDVAILVNLLQSIEDYDNIHEVKALYDAIEKEIQKKNG